MRISELSSQAGVPVATIKFYLRENLLQPGARTAATQAQYDDSHVVRLRLIRALLGPGGLSVAAAHRVIRAVEEPPESLHELLGVAANAVARPSVQDALRALDEAGVDQIRVASIPHAVTVAVRLTAICFGGTVVARVGESIAVEVDRLAGPQRAQYRQGLAQARHALARLGRTDAERRELFGH